MHSHVPPCACPPSQSIRIAALDLLEVDGLPGDGEAKGHFCHGPVAGLRHRRKPNEQA
jgi:hypothetical protein